MKRAWIFFAIAIVLVIVYVVFYSPKPPIIDPPIANTPAISYSVVDALPHDTSAFTEGLSFYKGQLWESTGLPKKSVLRQVDISTGKALKGREVKIDSSLFGEGVVLLNDTIYQLTWQNHKVLVYTAKDLKLVKELPYPYDGWGLTTDGKDLIASDGSSNLYFFEPGTFRLLRTQGVTEGGSPAMNLNELEYVNGIIYANQWQYNYILKIDPATGQVIAKMDLSDLDKRAKAKYSNAEFLNGIAYDSTSKKFYVTGKNWPEIYQLQFNY